MSGAARARNARAWEALDAQVSTLMGAHVASLRGPVVAVLALVGLLPGVNPLVNPDL